MLHYDKEKSCKCQVKMGIFPCLKNQNFAEGKISTWPKDRSVSYTMIMGKSTVDSKLGG